jgi:hypothetical protein
MRTPDFIVENLDWGESRMLRLDLHMITPSNDVVFLDGRLSTVWVQVATNIQILNFKRVKSTLKEDESAESVPSTFHGYSDDFRSSTSSHPGYLRRLS